jgi:creatinine amidohydrolase/Fe(II)-dependent formamide hydrolase-like protein
VGALTGAVVFPDLNYGMVEHPAFKGVFLSNTTYSSLVREVCLGVESLGFQKILFISGHGPNNVPILNVLKELYEERPRERLFGMAHCLTLVNQLLPDVIKERPVGHSDFRETSIMLALDESHVQMEKASGPEKIIGPVTGNLQSAGVHLVGIDEGTMNLCHGHEAIERHGAYGRIHDASKEEGEEILETLADFISEVVEELRKIKLPLT